MDTMKAYVLKKIGDISLCDAPIPQIKKDEVLIKVKAAGICGSDIPRIYSTGAHVHPIIPGHEFAGEVVDSFDNELVGKRVGIFPLIPCMQCECCKKKTYEMCRNYSYLGSRCNGGFAEYVVVPKWNLLELPENVSYREAAMLEPLAVAVHAVRKLTEGLSKNKSIAVWGLGTIGLMIVSVLKAEGFCNIVAIGKKENQRILLEQIGVEGILYLDDSQGFANEEIIRIKNGRGVDAVFECVGRNETAESCIDITAPGGRVMLVGNPYSDMIFRKSVYWKILRNELTVLGTWNSSYTGEEDDDWHYVLRLLINKRINVDCFVSHALPFEDLVRGLHVMRDKTEDYAKIMIEE